MIDGLFVATNSMYRRVINGQEIHGYSLTCYMIRGHYYGLKQFGHTHCERIAQEQISIPAEELLVFNHQVPMDAKCSGCGNPILPLLHKDESE